MADPVTDEVSQRDMLGAVATIARIRGWVVIDLHSNRTNPRAMSQPDFCLIREDGGIRFVKVLKSGGLGPKQEKIRKLIELIGVRYDVYTAADVDRMQEDLA